MSETRIDLAPIDSVMVTTLVDNYVDALLLDQGPAKRAGLPTSQTPHTPAPLFEQGQVGEVLLAEHGFSAMITFSSRGRQHHFLFDAGATPSGLVDGRT